jgi:type IV pilus assembly protein PilM
VGDSIWKKEISFGRKPKEPDEQGAPEAPAEKAQTPASAGDTPWWKKDVSLGAKAKQPKQPKVEQAAKKDEVPFWKRDVSLGKKKQQEVTPVEAAPEPQPAAAVAPEPLADEEPLDDVAERIAPFVAAAAEAAARAQAQAEAQAGEPPQPDVEATVELPAAAPAPVLPEPVAVEAGAPEQVDTWSQPPEVPPAPETPPTPAPQVVHPPVPASELPPLPDEKPVRKPFWKRDFALGRKKEAEPEAEVADVATPAEKPKPFWKRDFGRKAATPEAEEPPKGEKAPKAEKPKKAAKQKALKERKGSKAPKKLVGLKIGASQIAAARISNNGTAELVQAAREELEPGIVVGGELRDPEALAEALKEFFQKHKLPKRGVRLGIANNRIGVRTFDITGIHDQKQLTNAIKFRAQEALPIPIEDAVLDYHVLGERVDDEGQPVRKILLVVAYRELVDRYVDACRKAGIQLAAIDLEAFALLRAIAPPQEGAGGDAGAALVAVAIGHDRSTFAVSDGRWCEFTRVLEWGGSALNVAIARELNATPSQVEHVKHEVSLVADTVPEGLTPEQAGAVRDAVRKQVQTFARELVSSLQFYQSQPNSLGIGEIVLTGGTAHLHGLEVELQRLIGVRVRVADPLARVKVPKKFAEPDQVGSLTVAIGLGIED